MLLAGFPLAAQTKPTWEDLEARQARIANIDIRIGEVFDLTDPHEDHWIGRTANILHISTREQVVRRELLFGPGDLVSARLIHETERNLRAFKFFKDAWIEPRVDGDGTLRAVVHTRDAWTLKASAGFTQVGGQRDFGFSLHEANLLGFGKDLTLAHEKTPERSIDTVNYLDRQILGTSWTLTTRREQTADEYGVFIRTLLSTRGIEQQRITGVAISNVVPTVQQTLDAMSDAMRLTMTAFTSSKSERLARAAARVLESTRAIIESELGQLEGMVNGQLPCSVWSSQ